MRLSTLLLTGVGAVGLTGAGLAAYAGMVARKVEAALPPQGKFLEVDGARLHYLDQGSGPTIVMIHGLGSQMRSFTYALAGLLKDRFRVITVDRPGSGYSTRPPGASANLSSQARAFADFIHAMGLERPLLVGHSLGGALSLATALDHPECVGGLALLSPATQPQDAPPAAFKRIAIPSPWLRFLIAWTLATPISIARSKETLDIVFGPEATPSDFGTRGGGLLSLRPRAFVAASTDMMAVNQDLPGMRSRYPTLKVPVGVLFGDGDRILDPAFHGAGLARQIPGLELEYIEGGGHMIPLTQPQRCARFVERIAARVAGGAATTADASPV